MQDGPRFVIVGLAIILGAAILSPITPVFADPPGGFQHGKHDEHDQDDEHAQGRGHGHEAKRHEHEGREFQDRDRRAVRAYFDEYARRGKCPPGLAKKHNGCLPPGQEKHWRIGAPLPRDVQYYSLPSALVVQLTPPPVGYRYVRVASDILMIATGTGMVAAAIEDLGR